MFCDTKNKNVGACKTDFYKQYGLGKTGFPNIVDKCRW